jgi:hypothetical protein
MPIGSKVRVKNVAIRKITTADLAPKATSPNAGKVPVSQGMLPDWTWKAVLIGILALAAIYIPRFMPNREE